VTSLLFSSQSLSVSAQTLAQTTVGDLANRLEKSETSQTPYTFFNFALNQNDLDRYHRLNQERQFFRKKVLVHVGVGGSSLGPQMLLDVVLPHKEKKVLFFNNIDASDLERKFATLIPEETFFLIVSKSGSTLETLTMFGLIQQWLSDHNIPVSQWREYIVFCSDPHLGPLAKLNHELNWGEQLIIPTLIGGRFSGCTDAGAFPLFWLGHNPLELFHQKNRWSKNFKARNLETLTFFSQSLGHLIHSVQNLGVNQTVLMPYSSHLKRFGEWWVQLWAESLGKKGRGLTPLAAYGSADQHSQMQLFMEGPRDKHLFFVEVENASSLKLPAQYPLELASPALPRNHSIQKILQAHLYGTLDALTANERPWTLIQLKELNLENVGWLMFYWETMTVLMADVLNVDPFNQPGVEAGKKHALSYLHKNN
jgi:glucose-6-phosphate isomerase